MLTSPAVVFKTLTILFCCVLNGHITESKCRSALRCISIKECPPFVQLAQNSEKPLHPSIVQFLKSQQCDFAGGYPKVCCSQVPEHLAIFMTKKTNVKSPKDKNETEGEDEFESEATKQTEAEKEKWDKNVRKFFVGSSVFDLVGYNYRQKRGKVTSEKVEVEIR